MRPAVLALALLSTTGCGSESGPCTSGTSWDGGDEGSALMNPGEDCILCHEQGEGPTYDVAGTVFEVIDEPNDCYGAEGATIRITGADSQAIELTSNAAGNFFHGAGGSTIVFPITATVVVSTGENRMTTEQETGACNDCHTDIGSRGAPGRVTVP